MEIRMIKKEELSEALKLIWDTFLEFEAPDYSQQGVDTFHDFISNDEIINSLEIFGALVAVIAFIHLKIKLKTCVN